MLDKNTFERITNTVGVTAGFMGLLLALMYATSPAYYIGGIGEASGLMWDVNDKGLATAIGLIAIGSAMSIFRDQRAA